MGKWRQNVFPLRPFSLEKKYQYHFKQFIKIRIYNFDLVGAFYYIMSLNYTLSFVWECLCTINYSNDETKICIFLNYYFNFYYETFICLSIEQIRPDMKDENCGKNSSLEEKRNITPSLGFLKAIYQNSLGGLRPYVI